MTVQTEDVVISGRCDERFEQVADELRRNLAERGDLGASVAVMVGGEPVVDLWGGWADSDRRTPWQRDTLAVVMSCTKGVTAYCAHLLAATGELDVDAPVTRYWPEFGSPDTLVRHVLSHQAGLPALRRPLEPGAFLAWDPVVEALQEEEPWWRPGSAYGYHGFTFGFLVGELVRRVTGADIGTYFRAQVAGPLGLDLHIGLPASEHGRVAHLNPAPPPAPSDPVPPFLLLAMTEPSSVQSLMMLNTGGYFAPESWDTPETLSAVLPASGGTGNARSLAKLYDAISRHEPEMLSRMGAVQSALGEDRVLLAPGRWTLGFMKATTTPRGVEPPGRIVLSEDAFGHLGHGGSIGFCDPVAGFSFAYVMNQMAPDTGLSPTGQSLVDATYRALGYTQAHDRWVKA